MDYKLALTILQTLGLFAGGLGFLFSQLRKGKIDGTLDTIQLQNSRITALEADNKEKAAQLEALHKEVATLKSVIENKDRENDRLVSIFQNRNPEFQKLLQIAREGEVFMKNSTVEHKKMIEILERIIISHDKLWKSKGVTR